MTSMRPALIQEMHLKWGDKVKQKHTSWYVSAMDSVHLDRAHKNENGHVPYELFNK